MSPREDAHEADIPYVPGPEIGVESGWRQFHARERSASEDAATSDEAEDAGTEGPSTEHGVLLSRPDEATAADGEAVAARLERARKVMALRHPGFVEVLGVGSPERPYIAEALVVGPGLAGLLHEQGWLQPRDALAVVARLARALDFAHARRLVHGGVELGQVAIEERTGRVKLGGMTVPPASRQWARGRAPEDLAGERIDGRADMFGLGTLLFELLSGRPAFTGATEEELAKAIRHAPPPSLAELRPALPAELVSLVDRLLDKDPRTRIATGNALAEAIERLMPTISELEDGPVAPAASPDREAANWRWIVATALAGAAAAIVLAWVLWPREQPAPTAPEQAAPTRETAPPAAPTPATSAPPPATANAPDAPADERADASEPPTARADGGKETPAEAQGEETAARETRDDRTDAGGTAAGEEGEAGRDDRSAPATVALPDPIADAAAWLVAAEEINRMRCSRVETEPGQYRRRVVGVAPDPATRAAIEQRLAELNDIRQTSIAVRTLPEPFCDLLSLLGRTTGTADRQLVELLPARLDPLLAMGDILALSGLSPDYPAYVTVDYLSADGRVTHWRAAADAETPMPPGRAFRIGHPLDGTWYEVAPPFGDELVVAIAWRRRPDLGDRPENEPLGDYLPALERALGGSLDDTAPTRPIVASVLALRTHAGEADPTAIPRAE
ncbi:MAG: protein kinase [Geminicoccaceae bacterium]|nr:protein kinase [Geminicoccaceae bacterium]